MSKSCVKCLGCSKDKEIPSPRYDIGEVIYCLTTSSRHEILAAAFNMNSSDWNYYLSENPGGNFVSEVFLDPVEPELSN